ncbi:MAG: AAA family ATPase, partial [Candidatus Obscuribacterales bacterium]|nr:AAA family ATPase [Candidatus Obscuribacterales bacterium]
MRIEVPELCLVVLIGTSGSGKSTFGKRHFKPTEVISSDFCRGLVADDENDQSATSAAFAVLHFIVSKRLEAGRLTVVDATNVRQEDRESLIAIAKEQNCLSVAIAFNLDERICHERNKLRTDRDFGPHVISRQAKALHRSLKGLKREGFHRNFILNSEEQIDSVEIERVPLWTNKKHDAGPFDIIGDIHGCFDEMCDLLGSLGYLLKEDPSDPLKFSASHPEGRRALFVGDLVDRGPKTPDVLRLVMNMVGSGNALCVAGNHDVKLMRKLL